MKHAVYMYMYVYVYIYRLYLRLNSHTHTHRYIYIHTYIHTYPTCYMYIYMYIYIHVYICFQCFRINIVYTTSKARFRSSGHAPALENSCHMRTLNARFSHRPVSWEFSAGISIDLRLVGGASSLGYQGSRDFGSRVWCFRLSSSEMDAVASEVHLQRLAMQAAKPP